MALRLFCVSDDSNQIQFFLFVMILKYAVIPVRDGIIPDALASISRHTGECKTVMRTGYAENAESQSQEN